jgi:hypothetical protein
MADRSDYTPNALRAALDKATGLAETKVAGEPMLRSAIVRPVNSLIFISDATGGEVPEWVRGKLILSTSSCVSVGCYPEQDGTTEIVLGDQASVGIASPPAFDDQVETPSGTLAISTVDGGIVSSATVLTKHTRVRIWPDDPRWPAKIIIAFG